MQQEGVAGGLQSQTYGRRTEPAGPRHCVLGREAPQSEGRGAGAGTWTSCFTPFLAQEPGSRVPNLDDTRHHKPMLGDSVELPLG